jgi:hypothetical protein
MNREDKRAQVCAMSYLPPSVSPMVNLPGSDSIRLNEMLAIPIYISSGEWKEKVEAVGKPVEQELKATVTDTSSTSERELRTLLGAEGILLLSFTNGETKVVGTDEFPVLISVERSGSPGMLTLSFKRLSPEPAKRLSSF